MGQQKFSWFLVACRSNEKNICMDLIIIFFTVELVELRVRFKICNPPVSPTATPINCALLNTCGMLSNSAGRAGFIKLKNNLKKQFNQEFFD